MKVIGIIIEANPLHNGHQFLINQIKEKEKPDILIAGVSTYFSMRGDITCYPKHDKVNYLLQAGFDLIFEFPTCLSLERSDIFAKNAINILKELNITHLAFGMEDNDESLIEKVINIYSSDDYEIEFTKKLKEHYNYKKAQVAVLKQYFNELEWEKINNANFFLGMEYLKILKNTSIKPIIIKRLGPGYNDLEEKYELASATYLRELIKENKNVDKYLPYQRKFFINLLEAEKNLFNYWQYLALIKPNSLNKTSFNSYLIKNINFSSYNEYIDYLTTDKITKTRIKRTIIKNLIDPNFNHYELKHPYLRLLGFNNKGLNYLNKMPKEIKKLIFSNPNELNEKSFILENELLTAKFFDLITQNNYYIFEYKFPIRKVDEKNGK